MNNNDVNETFEKMEKGIEKVNQQIDHFQQKVNRFPAEAKVELITTINNLKSKAHGFEQSLDHFKSKADDVYGDMSTGIEMAWEDLNLAYESAKERFEQSSA